MQRRCPCSEIATRVPPEILDTHRFSQIVAAGATALIAGQAAIKELADGWTVVTKDHSLSAQWEHTVLVTDTGYEVLTLGAKERELGPPL